MNKQTKTIKDLPEIFSKKDLRTTIEHSFEWIRTHLITDEELTREKIPIDQFKRCKIFPPEIAQKIKNIIERKFKK